MALRSIIAITLETILTVFLVASLFGVAYTAFRANALGLTQDDFRAEREVSLVAGPHRPDENPPAYRIAK